MASAARSATRAFLRSTPATSSFRPAARSARFALPQGFRGSARRGYASEAGEKKGGSGGIFALAIAVAGGLLAASVMALFGRKDGLAA